MKVTKYTLENKSKLYDEWENAFPWQPLFKTHIISSQLCAGGDFGGCSHVRPCRHKRRFHKPSGPRNIERAGKTLTVYLDGGLFIHRFHFVEQNAD